MSLISMMIFLSIISLCWWRKNIIVMLLSMELILISLYFLLSTSFSNISFSSLLIMLVMMVSGSCLGLSLLISSSHSHNSSNSIYMNMLTYVKVFSSFFFSFYMFLST